jgi:hypothetical protein
MSEQQIPSGDFRIFVQKIAMQGFYALGLIEVPGAPIQEPNPEMARGVIDDLTMLREKCASNLEEGETLTLDKFISDLQNQVAELSK